MHVYETFFYINQMGTKHKNPKQTCNLKEQETEGKSIEYHQTKTTDRNTKEKNQWGNRVIRQQKTNDYRKSTYNQ